MSCWSGVASGAEGRPAELGPLGFVFDCASRTEEPCARPLDGVYEAFRSAHLDDALALVDSLSVAAPAGSRLALRTRLAEVRVLEVRQRLPEALEAAIALTEDLADGPHRDLLASTFLLRELIHEHLGADGPARAALGHAKEIVRTEGLDRLLPDLHVRASSFERQFGDRDRARAHADSALAAASAIAAPWQRADALFLQAALTPQGRTGRRGELLGRAAASYRDAGDVAGYAYTMLNLAGTSQRRGRPAEAVTYVDSLLAFNRAAAAGAFADDRYLALAYRQRAESLATLGRHDSAYAWLARAADLEQTLAAEGQAEAVARIERAYEAASARDQLAAERRLRGFLVLGLAALGALACALLVYVARLSRARRRIAAEVDRQAVLRGEMQHRVRNNLQILVSLLEVRAEQAVNASTAEAFAAMARRVHALANVHELLNLHDGDDEVAADEYLDQLVAAFTSLLGHTVRLDVHTDVQQVALPAQVLMPIKIIVNELLTNTLKHRGGLGRPVRVEIEFSRQRALYALTYRDGGDVAAAAGGGEARYDATGGLGLYLIGSMVRQLRGRLEREGGYGLTIRFAADGSRVSGRGAATAATEAFTGTAA